MSKPHSDPVPISEIYDRYAGQRVVVRVTAWGDNNRPSYGYVIAHGEEREVNRVLKRLPRPKDPSQPYYVFFADPPFRSGTDWRDALSVGPGPGRTRARRR